MKTKSITKTVLVCVAFLSLGAAVSCQRSKAPSTTSPQEQLDAMDNRQPVPLIPMMANHQKQNMRDHLLVVQEIMQALSVRDFAAVEKSAARISYSEQQQQMCAHMGAGADGFSDLGIEFHRTADSIIEAAKTKNVEATLQAVGNTLARCTSCHSTYRQQIVTANEWQTLTNMPPPGGRGGKH